MVYPIKKIETVEEDGCLYYKGLGYCKDIDSNRVPAVCSHCGGKVISSGLFFVCENNNENEPHYIKPRRFKRIVGVPVKSKEV